MSADQAGRMLLSGTWILWICVLMVAVAIKVARDGPIEDDSTSSMMLYYAVAFGTAPMPQRGGKILKEW